MVSKAGKQITGAKRGKVKVSNLKLKKETVKDLPGSDLKKIKGGITSVVHQTGTNAPPPTVWTCNCKR